MAATQPGKGRVPRWLDRRRLYTGGALMVLAPVGLAGCEKAAEKHDAISIVPADVLLDVTRDDGGPIAIAPPFDAWDATKDVMAIAPADLGPQDPGTDEGGPIAIAPLDLGPQDPGTDEGGPIAIAPLDLGPQDPGTDEGGPILIAPLDLGPGDPGTDEGGPILIAPPQGTQSLWEPCQSSSDCFQQYTCETVICIVAAPGCGEGHCAPNPCTPASGCPGGKVCAPISPDRGLCIRNADPVPGGVGTDCADSPSVCTKDTFCMDACSLGGMMCVVPVMKCLPVQCDPAKPACPDAADCLPAWPGTEWGLCIRK